MNFAVPADPRVKLKESEKRDKYLDLPREFKKLWNMKVTEIPIVIGALDTIAKGLVQGLEDLEIKGVETIQTTTLLRLAWILRRVLEMWVLYSHLLLHAEIYIYMLDTYRPNDNRQ